VVSAIHLRSRVPVQASAASPNPATTTVSTMTTGFVTSVQPPGSAGP
jgi:hypothetical protein